MPNKVPNSGWLFYQNQEITLYNVYSQAEILSHSQNTFRPRTLRSIWLKTRNLSAINQQSNLCLYTKDLMDMLPSFWIMRPLTFRK